MVRNIVHTASGPQIMGAHNKEENCMRRLLIVVDMQKDFVDGALGTKEAQAIVPYVIRKIKEYEADGQEVVFTLDTHFDNYLDTAGIPDPDLMIRTSGELRLSNFLLWQMAYTEFYFTDVAWPDFNKAELVKAIEKYNQRDRRYGGVKEE